MKGGKGVREMQRAIIFVSGDENNSVSGRCCGDGRRGDRGLGMKGG